MKNLSLKRIIYLGAVIVLLIFLHYTKILSPVESVAQKTLNPFFSVFYNLSSRLRVAYGGRANEKDRLAMIDDLTASVNRLTAENAKLRIFEEENKTLRQQLNFVAKEKKRYQMANVISRGDGVSSGQTITLDRGEKDGIVIGLPVVTGEGFIAGKIIETKEHLSQACLINGGRCQLAATVQNDDKTIGLARGELGLTVKMEFIPQNEKLKVGDIVVTSGLEENIERGLIIGQVRQVNKENNELWQNASIEPLIDLNDLSVVSVLLP